MSDNAFKFAQLQTFSLAGAGALIGDTSITLKSMLDINGEPLTMSDAFGDIGYGTLQPGNGEFEEQISFTGLVNNLNGTVTLTGVSSVLFLDPYTATSGLSKTHPGSTPFVISNTSGFYSTFANKKNEETIEEVWSFTPDKNPKYSSQPTVFGDLDLIDKQYFTETIISGTFDYFVDSGTVNAIVITPSPALSSYEEGQKFFIKVSTTNTGPTTIDINSLGVKNLYKNVDVPLGSGDILEDQIIIVAYDGTNFQIVGFAGGSGSGSGGAGIVTRSSRNALALSSGATVLTDSSGTAGSNAGNVMTSAAIIRNLYVNVESNSLNGDTVFTLLKNGSPTTVTITVAAGVSTIASDTSNAFNASAGDLITLRCDTTDSGSGSANVSFSYQIGNTASNPDVQVYTTDDTWTKPAGLQYIVVEVQGGGQDGNPNEAGGGGGYAKKLILATDLGSTETVTVGGVAGDSSFGAFCTGSGGTAPTGGAATGGDINIPGGTGCTSLAGFFESTARSNKRSAPGGDSVLGTGGASNLVDGFDGTGYGSGGASAGNTGVTPTNGTPGDGMPGIVIVTNYF